VDLIQKHKVHDLDFITGQPGITLLATGKASMASAHNEIWRELAQNPDNAKQVGVIPPIKRKANGEFIGGNFVVMARQTKHPEESWKFLEHLSSKDMTLKGDIARGAVPPRKSLQQSDYVKNNPILVAAMDQLPVAQREGGPERWLEIRSLWDPALVEAMQAQKSPEQALRDLTEKSNEILNRV
jgi:multiple sugar transport system substrate-binding protein